uniref:BHLH domain-containing protein n=1 Tax=Kalanchoe fedtschenkoi TaxID=63787 RepID=A0A7N0UY37_KALFE
MAMEALHSNDFLNFLIYDTLSATPVCANSSFVHHVAASSSSSDTANTLAYLDHQMNNNEPPEENNNDVATHVPGCGGSSSGGNKKSNLGVQQGGGGNNKKRRRKRARVCKNKEEAETQRMTHIVVERNRRKQMNEHLSVLRSLMPQSYAQRGDQASIVGGAIEFVKELEHIVQSLESQKCQIQSDSSHQLVLSDATGTPSTPFSQFFTYPQYTWFQSPNKYSASSKASVADIEVTLIETHANIRILTKRSPRQPYKLIASFHAVHLTILHLNITTMDSLVLYSVSAKVEEGCPLITVDDIAGAVHHMLRIIEREEEQEEDATAVAAAAALCS